MKLFYFSTLRIKIVLETDIHAFETRKAWNNVMSKERFEIGDIVRGTRREKLFSTERVKIVNLACSEVIQI